MNEEPKKVTVRASGKAHRAAIFSWDRPGRFTVMCSCPGSQNGKLANRATIVCEGWEKANCGN